MILEKEPSPGDQIRIWFGLPDTCIGKTLGWVVWALAMIILSLMHPLFLVIVVGYFLIIVFYISWGLLLKTMTMMGRKWRKGNKYS